MRGSVHCSGVDQHIILWHALVFAFDGRDQHEAILYLKYGAFKVNSVLSTMRFFVVNREDGIIYLVVFLKYVFDSVPRTSL